MLQEFLQEETDLATASGGSGKLRSSIYLPAQARVPAWRRCARWRSSPIRSCGRCCARSSPRPNSTCSTCCPCSGPRSTHFSLRPRRIPPASSIARWRCPISAWQQHPLSRPSARSGASGPRRTCTASARARRMPPSCSVCSCPPSRPHDQRHGEPRGRVAARRQAVHGQDHGRDARQVRRAPHDEHERRAAALVRAALRPAGWHATRRYPRRLVPGAVQWAGRVADPQGGG
mmetsp:Transcript_29282/g.93252  ORF Transcript_29282/g.93252 Transcript_29282/m.93252 type:complete len:232 (+) Transcript_29282:361-1056(+)